MAEGEGFEPPVALRLRLISSQVPSTTQPPFPPSWILTCVVRISSHGASLGASGFDGGGTSVCRGCARFGRVAPMHDARSLRGVWGRPAAAGVDGVFAGNAVALWAGLPNLCAVRFIGSVIEKLQRHPKRLVFPEGAEPRVLQAAHRTVPGYDGARAPSRGGAVPQNSRRSHTRPAQPKPAHLR